MSEIIDASIPQNYFVTRGDKWDGPVITITWTGVDLTACRVESQLRRTPTDPNVEATMALAADNPTFDSLRFQLSLDSIATTKLPIRRLDGDVKVSRTSPALGPYRWFKFTLTVQERITT